MNRFPDFLVVGAARAGTTALHAYLRQHPQIFMPDIKEPNYFAFEGEKLACAGPGADYINNSITETDRYLELFSPAPKGSIRGEASPLYLYSKKAPARIAARRPDTRLVVVLRNPIDQAYSHFLYATKQAIETETDLTRALELEAQRLADGWQPLFGYSSFPRYARQLERYLALFPREQIFIRLYEDFRAVPKTFMAELFAFLGADAGFVPDRTRKLNAGGVPKNRALQDFLMKPNPVTGTIGLVVPQNLRWAIRDRIAGLNTTAQSKMPAPARAILHERLDDDIRQLQGIIGRDLSHWLT